MYVTLDFQQLNIIEIQWIMTISESSRTRHLNEFVEVFTSVVNFEKNKPSIHSLIVERASAIRFTDDPISANRLCSALNAARFAPSSFNEQPWRFMVAAQNTKCYDLLLGVMNETNQVWARTAPALILGCTLSTFERDGLTNNKALYDLGAAALLISLQAQHLELSVHQIAGFDENRLAKFLSFQNNLKPQIILAIGTPVAADRLSEIEKKRKNRNRGRRDLSSLLLDFCSLQKEPRYEH